MYLLCWLMTSHSPHPRAAAVRRARPLAALAAVVAALAGCSAAPAGPAARSAPPGAILVNNDHCGTRWQVSGPGPHTFTIANDSGEEAEVDLVNPATSAVYAEVEGMGSLTTQPMSVDLGSGTYAFRCFLEDFDPLTGPRVTIAGHARGAPGVVPVTNQDLVPVSIQYHAYVTAGLVVLAAQTRALVTDIQSGQLAPARPAWLTAHLTYERLGAAYGSFGNYDTLIDTRADGFPLGVSDPQFTGFYRLEYGLWHGQTQAQLAGPAAALLTNVLALQAAWPGMEQDLLDLGLRTHEILENALQFQLSGHDDYGSGTTLATTAANITGTEELLTLLHPILVSRYPALPRVYTWLGRLQALLGAQDHGGRWTPASQLSDGARQEIDAAAGQALQELAPIAVITEPRSI
jgi:iron uptake system component EfeO